MRHQYMESLYLVPPPAPASRIQSHLSVPASFTTAPAPAPGTPGAGAVCWALSRSCENRYGNVLECLEDETPLYLAFLEPVEGSSF